MPAVSRVRRLALGAAALALAALGGTAASGDPAPALRTLRPLTTMPVTLTTARMTRFNPETQGFAFINTFKNVTGVFDITTGGLCGGMVYAALDYFNRGMRTPGQDYTPAPGTTLENYFYGRNLTALGDHMDKWVELHLNPGGARNGEFFRWGLQGTGGGRLQELRAHIDAGRPVPLGLKSMSANPGEDHVVLAYGYDMGRYKGDLGANQEDLKIFIYEPNYGRMRVTLVPRPDQQAWCYLEANRRGEKPCWRTYFVQQNYHAGTPPAVSDAPVELVLDVLTGGDDLRGGNDNVSAEVELTDGRRIAAANLNRSRRWIDHTWNTVGISLPDTVRAGQVRNVLIKTGFRGGFDGDNWNVDEMTAMLKVNGATVESCNRKGGPLFRHTGDTHYYSIPTRC